MDKKINLYAGVILIMIVGLSVGGQLAYLGGLVGGVLLILNGI